MHDSTLLLVALLATVALWLGVRLWWERGRASRASRRRQERARKAEIRAERLLVRRGFHVLERQACRRLSMEVDGQRYPAEVRADLLVERDGRHYVAEVKSGLEAPDPLRPATRRQLLEYHLVFRPDGVLLVDMETEQVHEVAFPLLDDAPDPE